LLAQWRVFRNSKFSNPPGDEAGTLLPSGSDEPRCWLASIKKVVEDEYNLAASRYKPLLAERTPEEDPAQLIRETLIIERDIVKGLEKLLREVEDHP